MRGKLLAILGVAGTILLLVGFSGIGHAQQFRRGSSATVNANEKLDSSAYLAGRNVDMAGDINGDLYCAGENVNISGTVHGDIICAGQTINLSGTVDGDVRIAGQSVTIGSTIGHNLTIAAQSFTLSNNGKVTQDITGGVDNMEINGTVGRDLVLGANTATINGTVGRNIKSQLDTLSLGSNAKVGGNIDYASNNQIQKAQGATVAGSINRSEPKTHTHKSAFLGIGFRIYWFFAMLLLALVLVLLLPSIFESSARRTMASFGRTLLIGIAAVLFTPVVFVLLMATIVGIPLGILLMIAWVVGLFLSGPFFAYLLGKEIWRAQRNPIWTMLVGSVLLLLVYNIPFVGFLIMLAALFIGMGMLVREIKTGLPKPRYHAK
jgi:hypothetical protein